MTDPSAIKEAIEHAANFLNQVGYSAVTVKPAEGQKLRASILTLIAAARSSLVMEEENKRLREALEFYAKSYHWRSTSVFMCGHSSPPQIMHDGGKRASDVLATKEQRDELSTAP